MKQLGTTLSTMKRGMYAGLAVALVLLMPAPYVSADSTSPASTSCTPVSATSGIDHPTGSDASTYTYDSCTGLWENQYYTWSPVTKTYAPKTPYVYACNTKTWDWTYDKWVYVTATGKWVQEPFTTTELPAGATIAAGSLTDCTPPPPAPVLPVTTSAPTGTVTPAAPTDSSSTVTPNTAPGGTTNTGNGTLTNSTGATVTNQIGSTGTTGSVGATANTTAGSVGSGNAVVTGDVVNNVASSSSLSNGNVVTFTANVNGNVQGDLIIDPNQIQPASGDGALTNTGDVTVNTQTSGALTNNITLNAQSGDANASQNTTVGNVTSGNADAIANVINILNSIVSAGKSFVGVININGNLTGNILMPQSFLDQLLATNAPHTTMSISQSDAATLGITNDVTNAAASGSASAGENTNTGNVGSGDTSTKVTIFNLTGNDIVGSNCLLVFVNVTGEWVGVIMNAPADATAAALGGGATDATAANVSATTNNSITNNINVGAQSGNASATENTSVGNVNSGSANTVVNLLNLNNSVLNLSGWFGVLFINVFGSWFGNFGVYTPPPPAASHTDSSTGNNTSTTPSAPATKPMFSFVPHAPAAPQTSATATPSTSTDTPLTTVSAELASATGQTLGAGMRTVGQRLAPAQTATSNNNSLQLVGGLFVAVGATTWGLERMLHLRRARVTMRA